MCTYFIVCFAFRAISLALVQSPQWSKATLWVNVSWVPKRNLCYNHNKTKLDKMVCILHEIYFNSCTHTKLQTHYMLKHNSSVSIYWESRVADTNFVITCGTAGFHDHNLQCHQRGQCWHHTRCSITPNMRAFCFNWYRYHRPTLKQ